MKRMMIFLAALFCLTLPVRAMDFTAPEAPEAAADLVPEEADTFAEGLWNVLKAAIQALDPSLSQAFAVCFQVALAVLLCGILRQAAPDLSTGAMDLAGAVAVAGILMRPSASLIQLGADTITELSEYGKLLLPVMTGSLAAQGGVTASTALYAGTAFFDTLLSSVISKLMIPLVYLYLGLAIAHAALNEELLVKLRDLIRWAVTWALKTVLYLFTGYMTITGVVSGTTDAATLKAAKITISGAVPVVGGILSDASEAVLVSAGVMRSAAGVYGLVTIFALFIAPFLQMGVQYLLLKAVSAVCSAFDRNRAAALVGDFSCAMGLMLGMVGTQTVLLLISTVCFMKGVS